MATENKSQKQWKKPTMKQVCETIDQMMANMNWLKNNLDMIGRLFDMYIEMKGDTDKFKKYLEDETAKFEKIKAEAEKDEPDLKKIIDTSQGESKDEQPANESTDEENKQSGDGDKE